MLRFARITPSKRRTNSSESAVIFVGFGENFAAVKCFICSKKVNDILFYCMNKGISAQTFFSSNDF